MMDELAPDLKGKIPSCATAGCGWLCCKKVASSGSGLMIAPGELDGLPPSAYAHLEFVADDKEGGKLYRCRANDTATCDGGYTPIDCRIYPLWPRFDREGKVKFWMAHLGKNKCPLLVADLKEHIACIQPVLEFLAQSPDIRKFFNDGGIDLYTETIEL